LSDHPAVLRIGGAGSIPTGEYYALMLFSIAGMMLMGSTRDLLVIFRGARNHVAGRVRADGHQAGQ
jgi:hypothetical protein